MWIDDLLAVLIYMFYTFLNVLFCYFDAISNSKPWAADLRRLAAEHVSRSRLPLNVSMFNKEMFYFSFLLGSFWEEVLSQKTTAYREDNSEKKLLFKLNKIVIFQSSKDSRDFFWFPFYFRYSHEEGCSGSRHHFIGWIWTFVCVLFDQDFRHFFWKMFFCANLKGTFLIGFLFLSDC